MSCDLELLELCGRAVSLLPSRWKRLMREKLIPCWFSVPVPCQPTHVWSRKQLWDDSAIMERPSPCATAHVPKANGRQNSIGQFFTCLAAQGKLTWSGWILKPVAEVFSFWVQCLMPSRCRRSGALPGLLRCSRLCIAKYVCLMSHRELYYVGFISTEIPEIRLLEISATLSSCRIQTNCQKLWEEEAWRKRTTVFFSALNENKDAVWRCEFSLVQNKTWVLKKWEFYYLL